MTADTAYQLINYLSNQFQRGNVSPQRFNLIINQASTSFLNYLLGQFQTYNYGKPESRVQFGVNETARQRLSPLINPLSPLTIDVTGLAQYPTGFEQVDAMFSTTMDRIRFFPQHRLYSYLNDPIDPINTNPGYVLESGGFRFYPNTTYNGTQLPGALLSYVQTPAPIFWNSTLDGNGRPVYSVAGSTGLPWYDVDNFEVVVRALKMVGVNLSVGELVQYGESILKTGQ